MGFWGVRTTFFCEAIWVVRIIAHQLLNVNPCGCLIWRFGRGNYTTRVNIHLEMTIRNLIILDYVSLLGVETIYELQAKWVVLFAAVCRSPKGSQRHIWSNFHSVSRPGWSSKTVVFFLGFSSMEWSLPKSKFSPNNMFFPMKFAKRYPMIPMKNHTLGYSNGISHFEPKSRRSVLGPGQRLPPLPLWL